MRTARTAAISLLALAMIGSISKAGMPSYTLADVPRVRSLADVAQMRLEVISFFGAMLLAFAALVQGLWNGLRKDFARLPRLSYFRALSVVALWGLLFLLVLTMISGARELLTPGAWEKVGATYRLAPEPPPIESEITERYEAITRLQEALWAGRDNGTFPTREAVNAALWIVPRTKGAKYLYIGGKTYPEDSDYGVRVLLPTLLAVEPEAVGNGRLAIFRNSRIGWISGGEIESLSKPEKP